MIFANQLPRTGKLLWKRKRASKINTCYSLFGIDAFSIPTGGDARWLTGKLNRNRNNLFVMLTFLVGSKVAERSEITRYFISPHNGLGFNSFSIMFWFCALSHVISNHCRNLAIAHSISTWNKNSKMYGKPI